VDRVDHEPQRRIDNGARLLGVEVCHQLGRTLDIGKQGGDCLALALDCFGPPKGFSADFSRQHFYIFQPKLFLPKFFFQNWG